MVTFLDLQNELAAQAGLDRTVAATAILLKRWLNNSQHTIFSSFDWPFQRSPTPLVVQTVPDYSTGTVTTTAGSTTITFSTTPKDVNGTAVSVLGRYIQTNSSQDWYKITAHTVSTTTATLEIAAINTAVATTFVVRKVFYSTASNVDQIIQISQSVLPYQLTETSVEYFQSFNPGFLSSGTPRLFMPCGMDSTGTIQFRLWPNPDAVINLSIEYLVVETDMVADIDVSIIPTKWAATALLEGAKVQAFSYLDDTRETTSEASYIRLIEEMKADYDTSQHRHRVMTSVDAQPAGGSLGYMPLPYNYPRNT